MSDDVEPLQGGKGNAKPSEEGPVASVEPIRADQVAELEPSILRRLRRLVSSALDVVSPDTEKDPKKKALAKISWKVILFVVVTVIGTVITLVVQNANSESAKRAENEAEAAIDSESPPFRATVEYNWDRLGYEPYAWVLDRALTDSEAITLQQFTAPFTMDVADEVLEKAQRRDSVDKYLRGLGARPVMPAQCWPEGPWRDVSCGGEVNLRLNLTGLRSATTSVTQMWARSEGCRESKAVTYIENTTQGEEEIRRVDFNIDSSKPVAMVQEKEWEEPEGRYFDENFLDLTKGATPVRMDIFAHSKKTCNWEIEADYESIEGVKRTKIRDRRGEWLKVEAPPANPQYYWKFDPTLYRYRLYDPRSDQYNDPVN
ncbi:hypothetical protein [Actinophytocola sp.]|uniref:hypothetical protein n=1 Tax=Actinophytocola sp. TaxID=1872138 RepID=UPI002ED4900F